MSKLLRQKIEQCDLTVAVLGGIKKCTRTTMVRGTHKYIVRDARYQIIGG